MNDNIYISGRGGYRRNSPLVRALLGTLRWTCCVAGAAALLLLAAATAGGPESMEKWMADAPYSAKCDYILLLPGGGIPSPSMLMRTYKAAEEYKKNPSSIVVVSLKANDPMEDSTLWQIRKELIFRGVPENKIILETNATRTAEHAEYIKKFRIGDIENDSYLVVSSPVHIKRSMLTFAAAGFKKMYAAPAFPVAEKENLGSDIWVRYGIWSSIMREIELLREFTAIAYYKIEGKA